MLEPLPAISQGARYRRPESGTRAGIDSGTLMWDADVLIGGPNVLHLFLLNRTTGKLRTTCVACAVFQPALAEERCKLS